VASQEVRTRAPEQRSFAFVFTDIAGSTRLWETEPGAMATALAQHDRILRGAIERCRGRVFKTVGDAFCAAFDTVSDAVEASLAIQRELGAAKWDDRTGRLRVRIGIHCGPAEERDDDYFGPTLNRTARLQSVAYGDQVLLSEAAAAELQTGAGAWALRDLGVHRLKDLMVPGRIYQVHAPDLPSEFPDLRTLDALSTNLPVAPNAVVGRDAELAIAAQLVRARSPLTIVGTGGVGKTRFALALAADVSEEFPDGVWFVDLSGVERGELIASSVAKVLGISERTGQPLTATIAETLADKRMLIVLDNCEHVIDAAARLVSACTSAARDVRFIATSREALAIAGEQQLRLEPLGLPQAGCTPEQQLAAPSIQLFIERAHAVRPDIAIGGATLEAVVEVCRRLDGVPLAIELAAARTALFAVEELSRRTDDLLRLLTKRSRDSAPRQQNIEALIDWSFRLLNERERATLECLSVFAGRFDVAAALEVCAGDGLDEFDVEEALQSLVEKSFVAVEDGEGTRRLRLYETIRQFAERRLTLSHERTEAAVARHVEFYRNLAVRTTDEALQDAAAFSADLDNIRVALRRAGERPQLAAACDELALAVGRYSLPAGAIVEGLAALRGAPGSPATDPHTALLIQFNLGEYAVHDERPDVARRHYERVAESDRPELAGRGEYGLAMVERALGRFDVAMNWIGKSIAHLEQGGPSFGLFQAYTELVRIELARGRRDEARTAAQRALDVARATRIPRAVAVALGNVAVFAFHAGDFASAARLIDETIAATDRAGARLASTYYTAVRAEIALFASTGDARTSAEATLKSAVTAHWLELAARSAETLAALEALDGRPERASRMFAWAEGARAARGIALDLDDETVVERKRRLARCERPAPERALAAFEAMTPEELLAYATEAGIR
jgi:predicted ATPase/class 3 adenylate cyclase